MPTVITHAVVGLGLGKLFTGRPMPRRFWAYAGLLPVLPDFDVIAFAVGIPYEAMLGHRGLSHSLCFALLTGYVAALITLRLMKAPFWDLFGFYFAVAASHGILDAFTNGGLGIAFFAPFDSTRYFFPWNPIEVSPIGAAFFSLRGLQTIGSELLWVWLPLGLVVGVVTFWRRRAVT